MKSVKDCHNMFREQVLYKSLEHTKHMRIAFLRERLPEHPQQWKEQVKKRKSEFDVNIDPGDD